MAGTTAKYPPPPAPNSPHGVAMDNGTRGPDQWLTKPLAALMALAAVVAMAIADPGQTVPAPAHGIGAER
ncbi:hypothetical protein PROPHIGD62-2_8 [Mycobacterium phage prophi62-2]|nr:hypothetical protein PROPHIGD62-2_8 [Mycobacterium phage prophi62-2]